MSRSVQGTGSTPNNTSPKQVLFESEKAYQIPSNGGLLKTEEWSLWQWIVFIFTWEKPTVTLSTSTSASQQRERAHHINLLFDRAQILSAGHITNKTADAIKIWLETKAAPNWLVDFAKFLNKADRWENAKSTTFYLNPDKETQELSDKLLQKLNDTAEDKLISDMINHILSLTITQNINYILTLETSQHNGASFCPLIEARPQEQKLHVTHPMTKATQTIRWDPKDTPEIHQMQLAQAISKLSQPNPRYQRKVTSPEQEKKNLQKITFLKEGNIYKVSDRLSLCPYPQELIYAGTDLNALDRAEALIHNGVGEGVMEMPIDSVLSKDKIQVEVKQDDDRCKVTYKLGEKSYTTTYPLKTGETLPQLARRLREDHTLERDLLLARSYFVRSKG